MPPEIDRSYQTGSAGARRPASECPETARPGAQPEQPVDARDEQPDFLVDGVAGCRAEKLSRIAGAVG
jgi:hypothetical protein